MKPNCSDKLFISQCFCTIFISSSYIFHIFKLYLRMSSYIQLKREQERSIILFFFLEFRSFRGSLTRVGNTQKFDRSPAEAPSSGLYRSYMCLHDISCYISIVLIDMIVGLEHLYISLLSRYISSAELCDFTVGVIPSLL